VNAEKASSTTSPSQPRQGRADTARPARGEETGTRSTSASPARDGLALVLVVATFSWIAFRNIRQPGYYGDEALAAPAAARFVWGRTVSVPHPAGRVAFAGHVFPQMLNSYIGPVKAYILAAGFRLFGVNVPAQRATTGGVGLLGVVALYFLARREFGRLAAAASALLIASDLSLALATRCDWGPIDFSFFAKIASISLLLFWQRNRTRPAALFFGSLLLGLGLSYKFDFLGTIAAVALAGIVFYGKGLRPRMGELAAAAGGFLLGAWPILLYNIVTRGNTFREGARMSRASRHLFLGPAVGLRLGILENLLGGGVGHFILNENFWKMSLWGGSLLPAAVLVLPLLLVVPFAARPLSRWRRPLGFLLAVFAVILATLVAVPMATGPHHVLSLYPFPHLFLGIALAGIWIAAGNASRRLRWPMRLTAAATFLALFVSNIALAETFHRRLATHGGSRYWSESIYDLSPALLKDYAGDQVELLDWGFEQPLIILGKDRIHLDPVFWRILADPEAQNWLVDLVRRPHCVFVRRASNFASNKAVHDRFDAAIRLAPDLKIEERRFFQRDGQLSFSLVKFRPPF